MELTGAQTIAADRMTVWRAINDPEILKECIPGCQEMEKTSPTDFEAVVVQKVGPVKATFKGAVTLEDIVEGESLTLRGEGKGGVAGMAKGVAQLRLADVPGGTELSYHADASVAGKIAQLGSRLIDGVAQKMATGFFDRFRGLVEGDTPAASEAAAVSAEPDVGDIDAASVEGHVTTADDVWQSARDIATHGGVGAVAAAGAAGVGGAAAAQDAAGSELDAEAEAAAEKAGHAMGDAARNAAETVESAIASADERVASAVARARDGAGSVESEAANAVEDAVAAARESVADSIARARETLSGGIASARQAVSGLGTDVQEAVGGVAENVANQVGDTLSKAGDRIGAGVESARDAVSGGRGESGSMSDAIDQANATMAESAANAQQSVTEVQDKAVSSAKDAVNDGADWTKGTAMAAASGVAAAVSGLAVRATEKLDSLHDRAKAAVIEAGKDVDEAVEWDKARTHLGTAADEAGDAVGDAWDAAKAKVQGASDVAAREWDEAKAGAGQAAAAAGAAGTAAWTATKGHAAEEAENPRMGPKGRPWYYWIALALIAFMIVKILF